MTRKWRPPAMTYEGDPKVCGYCAGDMHDKCDGSSWCEATQQGADCPCPEHGELDAPQLERWQHPVDELEDTTPVTFGYFVDFGNGYLMALPADYRGPMNATYIFPDPQPVPPEFQYAIDHLTHKFALGQVRQIGGPRCYANRGPQPTTEFVRLFGGRLVTCSIEEVAAGV